jgi:acyl-CoA reductase-like NAD-dependent aldehyde dehydrogenase
MSETSIQALLAHLSSGDQTVAIVNPTTGKRIYDLPQQSAGDVVLAVASARAAQKSWNAVSPAS